MSERAIVVIGQLVSSDEEYVIEVAPNMTVTANRDLVEEVRDYVDPATGIPVAVVKLRPGAEAQTLFRPSEDDTRSEGYLLPFSMGGQTRLPAPAEIDPKSNPFAKLYPLPETGGVIGSHAKTDCMFQTDTYSYVWFNYVKDDNDGGDHRRGDD